MTDAVALDALAELLRLPDWRIGDSRLAFVRAAADIVREVRDLAGPPTAEFLRDHGWSYDEANDVYEPLDEEQVDYADCDFCDRRFRRKVEGTTRQLGPVDPDRPDLGVVVQVFEGMIEIWGPPDRDDPDCIVVQDICDLCRAELPPNSWPGWRSWFEAEQEPRV